MRTYKDINIIEESHIIFINSKFSSGGQLHELSCYTSYMYYDTIEKSIASIVKCLIKNHCFSDGNKRTATVVFCLLCNLNNIENQIMKNASSIIENIASHNYSVEEVADLLFPNNVISSFLVFKRLKLDD